MSLLLLFHGATPPAATVPGGGLTGGKRRRQTMAVRYVERPEDHGWLSPELKKLWMQQQMAGSPPTSPVVIEMLDPMVTVAYLAMEFLDD